MIRYLVPVIDQGVVAAFNLALQLSLIRLAAPADYGIFVLWQSVIMMMMAFQDAMIGMPLSVRIAYHPNNRRRFVLERQVAGFSVAFITGAALLLFCGALVAGAGVDHATVTRAVALAAYGASFLLYSTVRYLALSRAAFGVALTIDSVYAVLSVAALAVVYFAFAAMPLSAVFVGLSAPALVTAVVGAAILRPPMRPRLRRAFAAYRTIWRDSRWTVAAVAAGEAQNRTFIFVLAALYGPAVMGGVFAGLVVLRHIVVLSLAWTAFARPMLVSLRDRGADRAMVLFVVGSAAFLLVLYAVNLGVLTLVWPLVEEYIYGTKYSDMWPVVALWTMVLACGVPVSTLAALLVTLGRFREDSLSAMTGTAVTVVAVTLLAVTVGARESVAGMALGSIITALIMAWRVRVALGERSAAGER